MPRNPIANPTCGRWWSIGWFGLKTQKIVVKVE
jgi:hypothetical protein